MLPVPASAHVANRPSRPAVTVSRSIRLFGLWFVISRRAV
jgi:hypothetical protein